MATTENDMTADARDPLHDGRQSGLKTGDSVPARWHRPVVTVIPLKMTLAGSGGTGSDGGVPHPFPYSGR
jgi:hypothetical protein